MKKTILCAAIVLSTLVTGSVFAQNGPGGGQRQQMMKAYLKDSVNLSDALTDSVMAIGREYQPQMRDIYMDQSASASDKQTKMQALRTAMEARYKSAGLTDEQIQKIKDREDQMRAQMRQRMNGGNS